MNSFSVSSSCCSCCHSLLVLLLPSTKNSLFLFRLSLSGSPVESLSQWLLCCICDTGSGLPCVFSCVPTVFVPTPLSFFAVVGSSECVKQFLTLLDRLLPCSAYQWAIICIIPPDPGECPTFSTIRRFYFLLIFYTSFVFPFFSPSFFAGSDFKCSSVPATILYQLYPDLLSSDFIGIQYWPLQPNTFSPTGLFFHPLSQSRHHTIFPLQLFFKEGSWPFT